MKTNNLTKKDKMNIGLNVAKGVCYALTFPTLFIVTLVICAQIGEGMSFYTFWPYLAAIIVGLLGLIFGGVAFFLNSKKQKAKRTVMQRTAILMIVCIVLTAGIGLLFDIGLPDALANATFGTLFAEDMYHNGIKESRIIEDYIHLYVGLNLLNGNYDAQYAYDNMKADGELQVRVEEIAQDEGLDEYADLNDSTKAESFYTYWFDKTDAYTDLDKELYDFIYENYVLMDYDHAFNNKVERRAFCLALTEKCSATYKMLCKEGFKSNGLGAIGCTGNEKLTAIFGQNYASQDMDGYMPVNEDSGIVLVTNNRMTIPVVVRMLLNDSYQYTQPVYGEDGTTIVDYDGFMAYLYMPEIATEYTGTFDESGRGTEIFLASDGNYYYAYNTGHVDAVINWCILDLLGEPMPLAEIDMATLLGNDVLASAINGVLMSQSENVEDLLVDGLTNSILVTATGGQKLYLNLYITDDGAVGATLYPQGMKYGYIGYQYMSWLEMGNLLLAVCGLVSLRNLLYIFSAVMMVMVFAIGFIDIQLDKVKAMEDEEIKDEEDADENNADTDGADIVDTADGAENSEEVPEPEAV